MRDSIPTIAELHQIGRESLAEYPKRLPYGEVKKLAAAVGLHEEWFRKARQLASQFKDRRPLDKILAFCKRHKYPFTSAHLLVMLPVPGAKWEVLITRAAKEEWSLAKLQSMILRKQGVKNLTGGRHRTKPDTTEDAYMELQRFQRGWSGLMRSLEEPTSKNRKKLRGDLPQSLRKQLTLLDEEMEKLSQKCANKLRPPKKKSH